MREQGYAQKTDVAYYLKAYPEAPLIYLEKSEDVKIKLVKNSISIIRENHQKFLVLKSNLNHIRNKKIRTDGFIKVGNLNAYHYVYNGSKHNKTPITDIDLKTEHDDNGTFYDDDKYYNIGFPNVKEGDIIEINYDEEYTEPRFLGIVYFSDYYPALTSRYTVSYPENMVKLNTREINNQLLPVKKTEELKKGNRILSWNMDSVPPLSSEDYEPSFRHKASYILLNIERYTTPGGTVNLCGNLDNLHSWYLQLMKNVNFTEDKELIKLTDSITHNLSSDLEKVKAIYYWVQTKIAYLAYEDGLGGYIPREAAVVCSRRFGDCKDMANLIVKMAQTIHLPVYHAWIGTRDIPYQFSEFPAPFCANHMIAAYITPKDTMFLDATGKYYPFNFPTAMIQDKEALISLGKDKYFLAKVPLISKTVNLEQDSVVLTILPGNKLLGTGYYKLSGIEKIRMMNYLDKKSYSTQKKILKEVLEKGNNKFNLDTFYISRQSVDKDMELIYKFSINDYLTEDKNLKFINLNFNKNYFDKLLATNRKYPLNFTNALTAKLYVVVKLEGKYKPDFIPTDVSFNNALLGFNQKYSKNNESVIFENTIYIDRLTITPMDFKDWNFIINHYKKTKSNLTSLTQN
ncbi:MAG: DUF3857 domain-containing protein [Bacteroidetes bacterium]|nr:DUF3857 domain-containing protein [Bacteroidota bacterium]